MKRSLFSAGRRKLLPPAFEQLKFTLVALLALLSSCVVDAPGPAPDTTPAAEAVDPFTIPLEEALDGMYALVEDLYGRGTRAAGRTAASVGILKSSRLGMQTRSGDDVLPENLAYVVNFGNDDGFAVLGANIAAEPVYCITESGSFTLEEMERIAREILSAPDEPVSPEEAGAVWMSYREMHDLGYGPEGNPEPFDIDDYNFDYPAGEEPAEPDTGEWVYPSSSPSPGGEIFIKTIITEELIDRNKDTDGDGIPDWLDDFTDSDGDGIPDEEDEDADGDGILDMDEKYPEDVDGDGIPDYRDDFIDSDGDGIPDEIDSPYDIDGDGIADLHPDDDITGQIPMPGNPLNNDGTPVYPKVEYTYGSWGNQATPVKGPFVTTEWNQRIPYNMWCPWDNKAGARSAAGCVAIALAQIIAFHEWPFPWSFKSTITSSWPELKAPNYNDLKEYPLIDDELYVRTDHLAAFISTIGNEVHMDYSASGSGATDGAAKRYLKRLGYNHVKKINGYNEVDIHWLLNLGYPIYIGAHRWDASKGEKVGHAWVIDGSARQYRLVTKRVINLVPTGSGGYRTEATTTQYSESRDLFHCNFGWGHRSDGYYVSGVFDSAKGPEIDDDDDDGINGGHYNTGYVIIQCK